MSSKKGWAPSSDGDILFEIKKKISQSEKTRMVRRKMNNTAKRNAYSQGVVVQGQGPGSSFGFIRTGARWLQAALGHAQFDSAAFRHETFYFEVVFPRFLKTPSNDPSSRSFEQLPDDIREYGYHLNASEILIT